METVPTLKRNKSGWFEIRWSEKDATGAWRSHRQSTHTKDQTQAMDALRNYLGNPSGITAWVNGVAKTDSIGELLDQYEQSAEMRGVKATQAYALRPIRRAWDALAPEDITPGVVTDYTKLRMRGEYTERRRPAASATIRRELAAFGAAMKWCVRKKLIKPEQCPDIDLPPSGAPREVFLTAPEADELWDLAAYRAVELHDKAALFACLALDTWGRANSIETLTWDRVHFLTKQIDLRDPTLPVTTKRRVPVPLSDRLYTVLTAVQGDASIHDLVVGPVSHDQWKRFIGQTRWPHLTRHDLRRTGASIAVHRGVDLMRVAQMLGDDPQTVIKHYARFAPDYLADVHKTTH